MRTSACGLLSFWSFSKFVRNFVVGLILLLPGSGRNGGAAYAQDPLSPEQLRQALDNAQRLLREAQDRKNQLAAENEKLNQQVIQLQKQISDMQGRMEEMKRTDAEHAEQTFRLRSHYAAWQAFIQDYPDLQAKWKLFLGNEFLVAPKKLPDGVDPKWPTSVEDE